MKIANVITFASAMIASVTALSNEEPKYLVQFPEGFDIAASVGCGEDDIYENSAVISETEYAMLSMQNMPFELLQEAHPLIEDAYNKNIPFGYQNLTQIEGQMAAWAAAYPDRAMLVDSSDYGPLTVEGRKLPLMKISDNVRENEDEPSVILVSMHHAREIITPVILMDFIESVLTSEDAGMQELVNNNQIYVMPIANPDGYNYVWTTNNMWRKNRKANDNGTLGVDQNRNYGVGWDGACPGSSSPSSCTYKGTAPASEFETQTILALEKALNVEKILDFHSSGREVLHSLRCTQLTNSLNQFQIDEAAALAATANYRLRYPSGDGQHQTSPFQAQTMYSFLIETETTFQPSFERAKLESARNQPLIRAFLERPQSVSGHVTQNGAGVAATITVDGLAVDNEPLVRSSDGAFGRFHMFLPDGAYTLRFESGEVTTSRQVVVAAGETVSLEIEL